jgi:hypothetical protein
VWQDLLAKNPSQNKAKVNKKNFYRRRNDMNSVAKQKQMKVKDMKKNAKLNKTHKQENKKLELGYDITLFKIRNEEGNHVRYTDLENFICDFLADYENPFSDDAFQAAFHATWGNKKFNRWPHVDDIKEYFSSEEGEENVLCAQYARISGLAYYFEMGMEYFLPPLWQVARALEHAQHKFLANARIEKENLESCESENQEECLCEAN